MTQYCRYCAHLYPYNGIWCDKREKELSEAYTKRTNKCSDFDFCSVDAYDTERTYQPRTKRAKKFEYFGDLRE